MGGGLWGGFCGGGDGLGIVRGLGRFGSEIASSEKVGEGAF